MKHIFLVHSPITWLFSRKIAEQLHLPDDAILYITDRQIKIVPPHFKQAEIPYPYYPTEHIPAKVLFFQNWNTISTVRHWIDDFTGQSPYTLYLPQSWSNFLHLLIANPACQGFAYFEEGLIGYRADKPWEKLPTPSALKKLLYQLNFLGQSPAGKSWYNFKHPKYQALYVADERAFPGIAKKVVLGLPFKPVPLHEPIEQLLVFDLCHEAGFGTFEAQGQALEQMITYFEQHQLQKVYFKFHPGQSAEIKASLLAIMQQSQQVEFVACPEAYSLEEICISSKPNVYTGYSSMGLYALLSGCKLYTYGRLICFSHEWQRILGALPVLCLEQGVEVP